jgi:RNA polymerase sigma-70 factor (ECF subfamily)
MRTERSEGLDGLSEADLVRGAGRGDAACFQRIMRLHNRLLFRTARAILRDDAEAEEAVQDAYVRAFRTLDGFRGEARLGTWLARIVSNEALARLRKATRRSNIVAIFPGYDEEAVGMEDGMESRPEKRVHQAELARLIERQVDALPELYRAVFVLRAVDDL